MKHVPPSDLASHWPAVREYVKRAVDRFGERITVEELYYALRQNMAALYMNHRGMLVAQKVIELDGTITLFVLIAAGEMAEDEAEWMQMLEKLAGTIGAVRIRMASPRKGWERVGWKVAHTVYEREVRNGNVQMAA